jgi:hypothetical protein
MKMEMETFDDGIVKVKLAAEWMRRGQRNRTEADGLCRPLDNQTQQMGSLSKTPNVSSSRSKMSLLCLMILLRMWTRIHCLYMRISHRS